MCPHDAVHPKLHDIHHWLEVVADECTGRCECLPYCVVAGARVAADTAAA